jgi:hypothetical protein
MRAVAERAWLALTTRRLLVIVLFLAIFAMAAGTGQPADSDTWWHLKSGQLIWQTGQLLRTDSFSYTVAGQPWIDHSWLVQVLLWPIYHASGLDGLALLLAALVTMAFALVYLQCEGKPFVAALVVLLAVVSSSVIWAIRPQLVSFLLAALVAFLLERHRRTDNVRWLWPIPFLVVLWVNSHAGFVIAFILIGCYLAGHVLDRLTARPPTAPHVRIAPLGVAALVSIPAILLNPHTVQMIPYAFQTINIGPLQDYIQEWAAPNFHNLQLQPFIWLLLLTLVAMGLSQRRADWIDLALVGVFGYLALLAVRNVALFALIAPPILTHHAVNALNDPATLPRFSWLGSLTHTLPRRRASRPIAGLNAVLLILVAAAAGVKVSADLFRLRDPAVWGQGLPLEAVRYLRDHDLPGNMLNTYNWGGYLIWSLYPDEPVFVDGRTDLYALHSQVLDDYVTVHWAQPGWQEILDRYQIGFVITERSGLLDGMLAEAGSWQPAYGDGVAIIYVRAGASP